MSLKCWGDLVLVREPRVCKPWSPNLKRGCGNVLSGPNSNHHLETTVYIQERQRHINITHLAGSPSADQAVSRSGGKDHWETKGRFRKRVVWRMYPRSGFCSGGTCERTLVPVFVLGEHPNVPSFRFLFRGNIRQNHPFGKPPFWQPRKG